MSKQNIQVAVPINVTPQAVIEFVADIRNRAKYLQSLKSISDIQREAGEVGTSWRWKWDLLGKEFEGTGRCVEYEAGQRYSFVTEGGIASRFTYAAEPQGAGTLLTIDVEFEVPQSLSGQEGLAELLASAKQRGQEAVQNLKAIFEQ
jgi:carbon monoxide dehydrogenase subunit G